MSYGNENQRLRQELSRMHGSLQRPIEAERRRAELARQLNHFRQSLHRARQAIRSDWELETEAVAMLLIHQ